MQVLTPGTLLAPIYNWFAEGFATTDLQEAQALLQQEKCVACRVLKRRLQLDNESGVSASVC